MPAVRDSANWHQETVCLSLPLPLPSPASIPRRHGRGAAKARNGAMFAPSKQLRALHRQTGVAGSCTSRWDSCIACQRAAHLQTRGTQWIERIMAQAVSPLSMASKHSSSAYRSSETVMQGEPDWQPPSAEVVSLHWLRGCCRIMREAPGWRALDLAPRCTKNLGAASRVPSAVPEFGVRRQSSRPASTCSRKAKPPVAAARMTN